MGVSAKEELKIGKLESTNLGNRPKTNPSFVGARHQQHPNPCLNINVAVPKSGNDEIIFGQALGVTT
jgi:hypothetical protein